MHNSAEKMLSSRQLGMRVYTAVAITMVLQDEICLQKIYLVSRLSLIRIFTSKVGLS